MNLLYILILISVLYNVCIIIKYKTIPESLSETSYLLDNYRWLFTLYCYFVCLCLLILLLPITKENITFIPFLFCGGLMFAGASPLYKQGMDRKVHYITAFLSFGSFLLYIFLQMGGIWIIPYLLCLGLFCIIKPNSYVYFAEILALIEIIIYLY